MVVPYNPIILKVPEYMTSAGGIATVMILTIVVLFFGFLALFFFIRGKLLQKRLTSEIRDVQAENGGQQTYYRVAENKAGNSEAEDF